MHKNERIKFKYAGARSKAATYTNMWPIAFLFVWNMFAYFQFSYNLVWQNIFKLAG